MKYEGITEIIKEICAKTVINGKTAILIGSLQDTTGKIMNHNKKLARFYNYKFKEFKEV